MRRGRRSAGPASSEVEHVDHGADGLLDEPRPRACREVPDAAIGRLIVRAMNLGPAGPNRWSTRSVAKATGLNQSMASRVRRAFALQMYRVEAFELSREGPFVETLRDVVGLRMEPARRASVRFVTGKPQIRALDRTRPLLPMGPGKLERRTHD